MTDITEEKNFIQEEETNYNNAVSESLLKRMGASMNWLIINATTQVGDVISSFLTEPQFQAKRGANWVLCDGQSVVGSDYETLTGNSSIPDLRGEFLRMADNGRGVDAGRALFSTQSDSFKSHDHSLTMDPIVGGTGTGSIETPAFGSGPGAQSVTPTGTVGGTGGTETRPRNVAINFFIKIND